MLTARSNAGCLCVVCCAIVLTYVILSPSALLSAGRASAPLDVITRARYALRDAVPVLLHGIPTSRKRLTDASLRGRIWNIMVTVDD